MGFLALALTHAGAAIRDGLCILKNYLEFYDMYSERIRRARQPSVQAADEKDYMKAYSAYEISYCGIEDGDTQAARDAIQLRKMFTLLHFDNIRTDILRAAVMNRELEEEQQKKYR